MITVTERRTRKRLRCTKRDLARAIEGAKSEGLQIAFVKIEPDGTIHLITGTFGTPPARRATDDKFQDIADVLP
jgi:hypothetical protein